LGPLEAAISDAFAEENRIWYFWKVMIGSCPSLMPKTFQKEIYVV